LKTLISWLGSEKGKGTGFSLLTIGNVLIAVITYLRFAEIASIFGTTWETDAFAVALVFPMLVQQVISHTFGSSFIPIYSRVRHSSGIDGANRLVCRIVFWIVLIGILFIAILVVLSRNLVELAGPGLAPGSLDLASTMLRIMLPVLVLSSVSGILMAFLTYEKRYGLISLIRILEISVSFLVVVFGHSRLGILVLPVSAIAPAVTVFLASTLLAIRFRFRFSPVFDPRDQDFRSLIRLAIPVMTGTLVGFLGPIADKLLASFLRESSVTAIDYANRLKNMVMVVFLSPLVTLADITFSRETARGDTATLQKEISSLLNWTSFIMVPIAAILTVLAVPIVSILFQRGQFTAEDSRYIGYALTYYAPWLAQFGIGAIVSRAFYSLKDSFTPVVIGIWGVASNVLLNIILVGSMGIGGLALATTATSTAKTAMLLYSLRRKLGRIGVSGLLAEQARVFASVIVMSGVMVLMMLILPFDTSAPVRIRLLLVFSYSAAGAVSCLVSLAVLRSIVLGNVIGKIRKKIGR
jgi:putative peptidoglycan lipid II flippase